MSSNNVIVQVYGDKIDKVSEVIAPLYAKFCIGNTDKHHTALANLTATLIILTDEAGFGDAFAMLSLKSIFKQYNDIRLPMLFYRLLAMKKKGEKLPDHIEKLTNSWLNMKTVLDCKNDFPKPIQEIIDQVSKI